MPGLEGTAIAVEQRARHCLIEARNARWLPVLERLLPAGDCFVAVGAIHLTGDHGLLAQLTRRGFTVPVEPWWASGAPPQPTTRATTTLRQLAADERNDRKAGGEGKDASVREELGVRPNIKKK